MRILIVEDNRAIAVNLHDFLESQSHVIDVVHDGVAGLGFVRAHPYDAILLDLGLPRLDGLEFTRIVREQLSLDTPILMLTARDTLDDKLQGFQHGADDYLVKPFALEEVSARLNALHKRHTGRVANRRLNVGELSYDPKSRSLSYGEQNIPLAPKCLHLIEVFLKEPDRLFSRSELEYELWGEGQATSDRLRHHIKLLRTSLATATGHKNFVQTVHGVGYRLLHSDEQD